MIKLFISCITTKFCQFKGRASRRENFAFTLVVYATYALRLIIEVTFHNSNIITVMTLISGCFNLILIVPSISLSVRRLHDFNYSGWWLVAATLLSVILHMIIDVRVSSVLDEDTSILVAFCLDIAFSLPFLLIRGDLGSNNYGEPPLR